MLDLTAVSTHLFDPLLGIINAVFTLAFLTPYDRASLTVAIDMVGSVFAMWVALTVTKGAGIHTTEERIQAAHRFGLIWVALAFGWDAKVIAEGDPVSAQDMWIRAAMIYAFYFGSWRWRRSVHYIERIEEMRPPSHAAE